MAVKSLGDATATVWECALAHGEARVTLGDDAKTQELLDAACEYLYEQMLMKQPPPYRIGKRSRAKKGEG